MSKFDIVYVLSNGSMPGLVKLGCCLRQSLEKRIKGLYSTGVPEPFYPYFSCRVKKGKGRDVEKAIFDAFAPYRHNGSREFFKIQPEQAESILRLFDETDDCLEWNKQMKDQFESNLNPNEKYVRNMRRKRRPNVNFHEIGIVNGSILSPTFPGGECVQVIGPKKVQWRNEVGTLSKITWKQRGEPSSQTTPTMYWQYDDQLVFDIWEEHHSPSIDN